MRWSYSASRSFHQCQRQWFFKNIVANANAKDPLRKQAHLLSKLQSISAWRGSIVDKVISETLIANLNRGIPINLPKAINCARGLFDRQLSYARRHPITDSTLKVSQEGEDFTVLHAMEYEGELPEHEIERAWCEIETALVNLFSMENIKRILKSANYIVPQRPLQFTLMDGVTVLAFPDAVLFRENAAPAIIDWKVHAFGTNDAWLQLAIYAIALSCCKPHKDFPAGFKVRPKEIMLYEVQLLTNVVREHLLHEQQIMEAEEYMLSSAYEIACLTEGKKCAALSVEDFRVTMYAETCQRCNFRAICWEEPHAH
jgi:hypothetical protein